MVGWLGQTLIAKQPREKEREGRLAKEEKKGVEWLACQKKNWRSLQPAFSFIMAKTEGLEVHECPPSCSCPPY